LLLLLSSALQLTDNKFLKLLKQSDMVNPQLLAHIFELSPGKNNLFTGSDILTLLRHKASTDDFCKSYSEALNNDIICVQHNDIIEHLAEMFNESKEFTNEQVVSVLKESCSHVNTFEAAGKFLHAFGVCLTKEDDAIRLIKEGDASRHKIQKHNILPLVLLWKCDIVI